jgi:hypothetical protein
MEQFDAEQEVIIACKGRYSDILANVNMLQ